MRFDKIYRLDLTCCRLSTQTINLIGGGSWSVSPSGGRIFCLIPSVSPSPAITIGSKILPTSRCRNA